MDPELKRLLQENIAVSKDNNAILRSIRQHQWFSSLLSSVFWIVVVALPIYLFQQYVRPVVNQIYALPGATTTFGLPSSADIQKLIDSYRLR